MKNKGFTLIELLAVIVILAIIALIAIPMISKIIDKTEDSAVLRSAELYIDGVNQSIMRANLNNKFRPKECIIQEDGNLICDGNTELKVETTGTRPSDGILVIEDRHVKSFTGMMLDIYKLEMNEDGKIVVVEKIDIEKEPPNYLDSAGAHVDVLEGLTPVMYRNNNWIVANIKEEWYNYDNQEWANAVILKNGVTKEPGDIVDVTLDVQGMFVYVPRYEYKIEGQYGTHSDGTAGTSEQPGEIKINFISKETIVANDDYILHPAFIFGDTQLNGIWVGKFETTGTVTEPSILPSSKSLVSQVVSSFFTSSQLFNKYLINADAHMAKNSDWGAAAYLSQSKYGKYGNSNYTGASKEVMINNCKNYITGIAANAYNASYSDTTCTTNTYETVKGQAASTTGNITGIYDMSGGAWDYVMGVSADSSGNPMSGFDNTLNSGYNGYLAYSRTNLTTGKVFPSSKYYNLFTSKNTTTACDGGICYGHALSETQGWYGDVVSFKTNPYPWFLRGGSSSHTDNLGVFTLYDYCGQAQADYSFRIVITNF